MADATVILLVILVSITAIAVMRRGVKIIRPYEQGIYLRRGRLIRTLHSGFNFVAPLFRDVVVIDLSAQEREIRPPSLATEDGKEVVCRIRMFFSVEDAKKALFGATSCRTEVERITCSSTQSVVSRMKLEEILSSRRLVEARVAESVSRGVRDLGVRIHRMDLQIQDASTVACQNCGFSNPVLNSYCGNCGKAITIEPAEELGRRELAGSGTECGVGAHKAKASWAPDSLTAPYEVKKGPGIFRRKGNI